MMAKEFKKSENEFRKIVFKPKRKLGQNFLFDKNYLRKILTCIKSDKNLVLVEIGSGYGTLTKLLMKKEFKRFFSIEKDNDLFQKNVSEKEERGYPVDYILGDALKID
jgi:16S rRNA (adenine1518-N6/adenine1519-N6)-dimethyltransferase